MIRYINPTQIRLEGYTGQKLSVLRQHLTYHDKKVDMEYQKAKHSGWLAQKLGEEGFREHLADLKSQRMKCILFEDESGLWTYSGLAQRLANAFDDQIVPLSSPPERKLLPWANKPKNEPRYYQIEAQEALLKATHGGVEIGTGLGKSTIIQFLTKHLGMKTLIMAPSESIFLQLAKEAELHFGKKYVGRYGAGKKEFKKLITIAIGASLTRIEEGTPAFEEFSKVDVFIADESHLTPAKTLQSVCFELVKNAQFRFFFSGTQMRNDGLDLVLEGITGPIVYEMTVREGVDKGFLAKPIFTMVTCGSESHCSSKDANLMTRQHLYYNPEVNKKAADLANKSVELLGLPTLILVEEMEQLAHLLPYLKHKVAFAHGGVTKENKDKIPAAYHDSDPNQLVDEFNAGNLPILIGTSCIATGTDIKVAAQIIYVMGGKSEIKIRQAIGRGTRLVPGKTTCYFTDFDIADVPTLHRHANARRAIYEDVYAAAREIK